jgi:hypothetical protein
MPFCSPQSVSLLSVGIKLGVPPSDIPKANFAHTGIPRRDGQTTSTPSSWVVGWVYEREPKMIWKIFLKLWLK